MNLTPRDAAMIAAFRTGDTLAAIGLIHGVTRERVRQIMAMHGVKAIEGGRTLRTKARNRRKLILHGAIKDERMQRRFGCSVNQYKALELDNPGIGMAYTSHKRNALFRSVPFLFTLPEWYATWLASGKWHRRGKHGGQYVMSRRGDKGAYSKDNVIIQTCSENCSDGIRSYWKDVNNMARTRKDRNVQQLV